MNNAGAVPVLISFYKRKNLEAPYRAFAYYLLVGAIAELLKGFTNDFVTVRLINYAYYLLAYPFFLYSMLMWSGKEPYKTTRWFFLIIVCLVVTELCVYGPNHQKVSLAGLLVVALSLVFPVEAFVHKISAPQKNSKTLGPLLFMIPIMVLFLCLTVLRLMMLVLFSPETKPLFNGLWKIVHYVNLAAYLSFSLAFIWAPKKEKYLMLSG